VTLPEQIPVRFIYHKYYADYGSGDYGQEFDVMISKKFGRYWNVMVEFANYLGEDVAAPAVTARNEDVQKFWAAVEFNF
jgi:hypothetical protein